MDRTTKIYVPIAFQYQYQGLIGVFQRAYLSGVSERFGFSPSSDPRCNELNDGARQTKRTGGIRELHTIKKTGSAVWTPTRVTT